MHEITVVWKFHTLNYIPQCISHGKDYFGKCWNDLNKKMKFPDRANQHLIICHSQTLHLHVFPCVIAIKVLWNCQKRDTVWKEAASTPNNLFRITPALGVGCLIYSIKPLCKNMHCHCMPHSLGWCPVVRWCVMTQISKMHGFHSALAQENAHDVNVMANEKCWQS